MKHSIVCLSLALLGAGCVTSPRKPAVTDAPAQPPVTAIADPWARSVPAAPAPAAPTPAAPAEAPMTTATPPKPAAPLAEAKPADATESSSPSSSGRRTHVVAKGETLFKIAQQYYGDGTKWPRIVEANPGLKPESLSVGKSIVVP